MVVQKTQSSKEIERIAKEICRLHFEENWSFARISIESPKVFGKFIFYNNASRTAKRWAAKFGYSFPKQKGGTSE